MQTKVLDSEFKEHRRAMYGMLVGELLKKRYIVRARRTRQWEEHWNRNQEN